MKKAGIVAFAFGVPETILSNRRIASVALDTAREFEIPVYAQKDICIESDDINVRYTVEQAGNPSPTLRIARSAVYWAKNQQIEELWIVAAKPHLWRCIRDLKYAIKEIGGQISVKVCTTTHEFPEDDWFCPGSTQKRTRSREEWEKRERIIRHMPMFIYKRIAS